MATNEVELKLLINKEKNRVVLAESDKHFVDALFSFLTVPMGTLVQVVGEESSVGCMGALYEAVKNLDSSFFQTEAAKQMLLLPKSAAEIQTKDLKLSIDPDDKLKENYLCTSWQCAVGDHCLFSAAQGAQCRCGQPMNTGVRYTKSANREDGVFVNVASSKRFIVDDDLKVNPVSMKVLLSRLNQPNELGIGDSSLLETKTLTVGPAEVLQLMIRSLVSATPLTDVLLEKKITVDGLKSGHMDTNTKSLDNRSNKKGDNRSNQMSIKLLYCVFTNKVLCAEAEEDFVDLLFSFLTFPFGLVVKLLGSASPLVCFNNLYKSAEALSNASYMDSEKRRDALLDPKLAAHFSCEKQLMKIAEATPESRLLSKCQTCYNNGERFTTNCAHGLGKVSLHSLNPKQNGGTKRRGFLKEQKKMTFMVTDDLDVKPLSAFPCVSLLDRFNIPPNDLMELEVSIGEEEVSFTDAPKTSKCFWYMPMVYFESINIAPSVCIRLISKALALLKFVLCSKTILTDFFRQIKHKYKIPSPTNKSKVKIEGHAP